MKAIFPVAWVLVSVLSAFGTASVLASPAQEKVAASATANKSQKTATAKKAAPVKKAAVTSKAKPKAKAQKRRAPIASKSKPASEIVRTRLPSANVDLSLPPEMVKQLQPIGSVNQPKRTPLLPPMFGEKPKDDSPFQLNGRLLSNEMQLQLRNDERRDVEGAALDFEFKQ
ncbi:MULTISPECIES: translation initiation factor 2 [Pseudomonas]|uniref:translation initiation factor 2 n=1 Tax=Pseudomonas TaxID=286 RepID=UPI000B35133D|nr:MULTISPECIES: translation initiation factor 2 [Pseudomonas]PMY70779.1 glucose-6-phosphate dehydrogenase [Pseudomonas sp. FW305-25]PMY75309.1 glucose-6-phosphate dehydrogenase [Pseudomonas sp. FW126-L8]PNA83365.1 glucose-6-phosphate dehydrogenase [Pseudomonas sp. FW305-76]